MYILSQVIIVLIILIHLYILWFEMFAWETRGPNVFKKIPKDLFPKTKTMAANQGLYNGFLATGLIWSLIIHNPTWKINIALFFLSCIAIAGIYGAMTVSKRIIYVQTLPAILAIILLMLSM